MAKYKRYPEYKDSGVEWLDDIPEHWNLSKISWNFKAEKGKNGQLLTKEYCGSKTGEYPVYSGQTENDGIMGRIDTYEFDSGENGVLFSTTVGAKAMHLSHLKGKFSLSQNCMIIMPLSALNVRYCYYHFQPLFAHERGLIPDHMQASFRMEDLYQYKVILPPFPEQKLIARFLDHETGKIDRLIQKQQQLIELLKEKRQAVISHAVTKGLNPNAPLKPSNIEWLGDVPEHWEVKKLKHIIHTLESGVSVNAADTPAMGNDLGVLKTSCVYTRSFRATENKTVLKGEENRVKCRTRKGAIIISRMNTPELVGASAVVDSDHPNIYLPDRLWQTVFESNVKINSTFIAHFMTIMGFRKQISLAAEGASSSMQNIAKEDYLSINVLLPSLDEQNSIVNGLATQLRALDSLNENAIVTSTLLQERRTALISAAVTGKIDVRDWQPPTEGKSEEEKG